MSDTNLYLQLRGSYAERKATLAAEDRAWLEAAILDGEYNDFLRDLADYREGAVDPHGHGKRVPYIGWYWRHVAFSAGTFSIGNCGDFIGFMENNKWGYPERLVTPDEFAAVMAIIDAAMVANSRGGRLDQIVAATHAEIDRLWDYLQTLEIGAYDGDWQGSSSLPAIIRAITP